jgi:hypothetical protein
MPHCLCSCNGFDRRLIRIMECPSMVAFWVWAASSRNTGLALCSVPDNRPVDHVRRVDFHQISQVEWVARDKSLVSGKSVNRVLSRTGAQVQSPHQSCITGHKAAPILESLSVLLLLKWLGVRLRALHVVRGRPKSTVCTTSSPLPVPTPKSTTTPPYRP